MAKKGQRATWENDHLKSPEKPMAARVPEVNKVGKNKQIQVILKNKFTTIEAKGKSTPGVLRKLRRQICSLER